MTIDELRRLSREVEWTAQQSAAVKRDDDGAFEHNTRRFRELVALARNDLVRGNPIARPQATAIRGLAAVLLDGPFEQ
jgi:hypothetical protein